MFKKGDKYIHFTKYGGVNKGEVEWVNDTICIDTVNKIKYTKTAIKTTKGVSLSLDGTDGRIYKIKSELTDEQCETINNGMEWWSRKKAEKQAELQEYLETHKDVLLEKL